MKRHFTLINILFFVLVLCGFALSSWQSAEILHKNDLLNPGAEQGKKGWSATGGAFTISSTAAYGGSSFSWDPGAAAQLLQSDAFAMQEGLRSQNCVLQFKYQGAGTADIDAKITDGTNQLGSLTISDAETDWRQTQIAFVCPSSGNLQVEFEAQGDAAAILLDDFFVGENPNVIDVEFSSEWTVDNAPVLNSDTSVADKVMIYRVVGDSLEIKVQVQYNGVGDASEFTVSLPTGFTADSTKFGQLSSPPFTQGEGGSAYWSDAFTGVKVLNPRLVSTTNIGLIESDGTSWQSSQSANNDMINIHVTVPIAERRLTVSNVDDLTNWYVDVTIAGANPGLPTSDTAYGEITNTGLSMTLNGDSQTAQIACASGTASEGLNCNTAAVAESVGVARAIPVAGEYEVCAAFAHDITMNATSDGTATFRISETSNTSSTPLQAGEERAYSRHNESGGSGSIQVHPVRICERFKLASAGLKTFRLESEVNLVAGTFSAHQIRADQDATLGEPAIRFTIRPITPFFQLPKVLNQVQSAESGGIKICRGNFSYSAGTPQEDFDGGNCFGTLVDNAVGDVTINFEANVWAASATLTCVVSNASNSGDHFASSDVPTTTSIRVKNFGHGAAAAQDDAFQVICMGERP